jgi:hypothetical protein
MIEEVLCGALMIGLFLCLETLNRLQRKQNEVMVMRFLEARMRTQEQMRRSEEANRRALEANNRRRSQEANRRAREEMEPYDEEEMRRFLSFFEEYNYDNEREKDLWEEAYICCFRKSARVIQRAWRRRQLKNKTIPALKIQRAWRKCISDPSHAVCKRRLLREFKECGAL